MKKKTQIKLNHLAEVMCQKELMKELYGDNQFIWRAILHSQIEGIKIHPDKIKSHYQYLEIRCRMIERGLHPHDRRNITNYDF